MFDTDLFFHARWDQLYDFFVTGYPPLVLKLLAINTVFLLLFIVRRASKKTTRRNTSGYAVQALLIAANGFVVFDNELFGFAQSAKAMLHF
jgi:hypothetical protein